MNSREAFETDAGPYGYDLTIGNETLQMIRGDVPFVYQDERTNDRWLGWLASAEHSAGVVRGLIALVTIGIDCKMDGCGLPNIWIADANKAIAAATAYLEGK